MHSLLLLIVFILVVQCCCSTIGQADNFGKLVENVLSQEEHDSRHRDNVFYRKRRYLIFPEGTSFQIVWDGIIGVVDYTNYLILGITVAMAWELPSKAPSELYAELQDALNNGTLGFARRNDSEWPSYVSKYRMPNVSRNSSQQWINTKSGVSTSSNKSPFMPRGSFSGAQKFQPRARTIQSDNGRPYRVAGYQQSPALQRMHYIYPVFGKRSFVDESLQSQHTKDMLLSANNQSTRKTPHQRRHKRYKRSGIVGNELSQMDCIHIRRHRTSRHELYAKIEKYLDKRGVHGHHCVLRALCETGQRSNEQSPGSFVAELMRTIFTLPEDLDGYDDNGNGNTGDKRILRYDRAANGNYHGNCAMRYQRCKDSLWTSDFVI